MYFKVLTNDLRENGYYYKEGLNIAPSLSSYQNGNMEYFNFGAEDNICSFFGNGDKISEVKIPLGEEVYIKYEDGKTKKCKSKKIILENIRDLWTVETFDWLKSSGVDLHKNNEFALRLAAEKNHLNIVKYLVEDGSDIHVQDDYVFQCAIYNNNLSDLLQ